MGALSDGLRAQCADSGLSLGLSAARCGRDPPLIVSHEDKTRHLPTVIDRRKA
jgi:hypothetical protein